MFNNNSGWGAGGACAMWSSPAFKQCLIIGNTGDGGGGGIQAFGEGAFPIIEDCKEDITESIHATINVIANSALDSARGNSGTIIAQFFHGMRKASAGKQLVYISDLAEALKHGYLSAKESLLNPQEGTIITVMREVSDKANDFGIYQVFGDMTISILNGKNGEEILSKSFNKIQGSDFQSNQEAANHSLKKMSEKITEDFLPGIIDLIQGI